MILSIYVWKNIAIGKRSPILRMFPHYYQRAKARVWLHCLPASCPGAGWMLCTQGYRCRWLRPSLHPGSSLHGTGHMEMRGLAQRDREAAMPHCGQTCGESTQPGSGTSRAGEGHSAGGHSCDQPASHVRPESLAGVQSQLPEAPPASRVSFCSFISVCAPSILCSAETL